MVQKIEITEVDDLDETLAAEEKVRFGLDGADYEIDLSGVHAAELRESLRPYVEKARRLRNQPAGKRRRPATRTDLPDIREYARARGYEINERGRVPGRIVEEYDNLKVGSAG